MAEMDPTDAWQRVEDALAVARGLLLDAAPAGREADAVDALAQYVAAGLRVCVELGDPDRPLLGRMVEPRMRWGLDHPDCVYLYATVRAGRSYRIHGEAGTANLLNVQVNRGHFASGRIGDWTTVSSITGDELTRNRHGHVDLTVSADPQPGDWLALDDDTEFVLIRQYVADWERERPATLAIERIDARESTRPGVDAAAPLARLADWLGPGAQLWHDMSQGLRDAEPHRIDFVRGEASVGLGGQAYGLGGFHCRPGEAVVLTWTPPAARHWNVSLADPWWRSIDPAEHQSSLNHHQATFDDDGAVRFVIAHDDPGVANWLAPGGNEDGTLSVRVQGAEEDPPPVEATVVEAGEIDDALPASTARVAAAERRVLLAHRRAAALARFRS